MTAPADHPSRRLATAARAAAPSRAALRRLRSDGPDELTVRFRAASGWAGPDVAAESWVDSRPLRRTDPIWVDGYRLVSRLGTGGMADVFSAVAPGGAPVAVKLLRAATATHAGRYRAAELCRREYRLVRAVDPHSTAPAMRYGVSTAGGYLVTAHLPGYRSGRTLLGRLLPATSLWTFGSALARVLAAVHARGVVHCDVKPSNLLVRGHDVRLIDFGIARYIGEWSPDDGTVQCSRGWAAPEQLHAGPATPAVDVFAWGCVLAYLAGGVHPFRSHSADEWIQRLRSAEPDLTGVPADLAEVIRATLARDPRNRPTARELTTICRAHGETRPRTIPDRYDPENLLHLNPNIPPTGQDGGSPRSHLSFQRH